MILGGKHSLPCCEAAQTALRRPPCDEEVPSLAHSHVRALSWKWLSQPQPSPRPFSRAFGWDPPALMSPVSSLGPFHTFIVPAGPRCVVSRSVSDCAIPWSVGHQAPLSMEILQARILECVSRSSSRASSQDRDQTKVSRTAGGFFTVRGGTNS